MKKAKIIRLVIYAIFVIFVFLILKLTLFYPSLFNKTLFKLIGTGEFSSTNLKIELIDMINKTENYHEPMKKISYLHNLSEKELDLIEEISLDYNFTTEDIRKLRKLKTIYVDGIDFKNDIDFSKNSDLSILDIRNSKLKEIIFGNTVDIGIQNSSIDDGNIIIDSEKLSNIYISNLSADNLTILSSKELSRIDIIESNINNIVIKSNEKLEYDYSRLYGDKYYQLNTDINIDAANKIELKNVDSISNLLFNSNIKFKELIFNDKKIYLDENDNNYIEIKGRIIFSPFYRNAILAENMSVENNNGKLVFKDSSGTILELE